MPNIPLATLSAQCARSLERIHHVIKYISWEQGCNVTLINLFLLGNTINFKT